MTEKEVRRVRLFAEAARLTDFDTRVTVDRAQRELGQRHVDVDLLDVEVLGPDSVVVSLHLPPSVRTDDGQHSSKGPGRGGAVGRDCGR